MVRRKKSPHEPPVSRAVDRTGLGKSSTSRGGRLLSSGLRMSDRAGDLIDLLYLEPVVGMFLFDVAYQRLDNNRARFPLDNEITVNPQFLATDRGIHGGSPIAQPDYPTVGFHYC